MLVGILNIENKLEKDMKYGYRINIGGTTAIVQYQIPLQHLCLDQNWCLIVSICIIRGHVIPVCLISVNLESFQYV
jgi:hypothetical protein